MKSSENLRNMLWSALLGAALLVFALFSAEIPPAGPLSAHAARERVVPHSPGPDLVIQSIRTVPTYPNPGEPVNIEVVIRNAGDAKATPAFDLIITGMYVDLHREPQLGDPDTSYTGLFALNAGQDYLWIIKNHIFTAAGCDHDIWAWTDRESAVIEDNELNNKLSIQVCVGSTPTPTPTATGTPTPTTTPTPTATPCVPDVYEVGADDTCAGASPITVDSVHQMHNLCPVGDVDWVSFPAQQGITYTLSTANVGVDGDTTMLLYNQCAQPTPEASSDPAFGNGVDLVFEAPESGTYYLKVKHHDESYGDATGYELFVSPSTTCQGDTQETDDSCSTARDLAVGAAPVARQFCKPADADWAKFAAYSGATYSASAVPLGAGADPHFQIYDQCGYAAALSEGQTASWTAASSGTYYIKITNQNPNVLAPPLNTTPKSR